MQINPEKELYSTVIRQYPDIPRIPMTNILKVGQNGMTSVSGSEALKRIKIYLIRNNEESLML